MAQLSAYMCVSCTSAYSRWCKAVTVWRQNRPDCITLAFSTEHSLATPSLARLRASSKATRDTRSISLVV